MTVSSDDFFDKRGSRVQAMAKRQIETARSRGIDTRSIESKKKSLEEQQAEARDIARGSDVGGDKSSALKLQATESLTPTIQNLQKRIDQKNRIKNILLGKTIPKKSDFTGFTGGTLGIRTGKFEDVEGPKIRDFLKPEDYQSLGIEGLGDYASFMGQLYQQNPKRMESMFPVASGKFARQVFTPAPLKFLASQAQDVGIGLLDQGKKLLQDRGNFTNIKDIKVDNERRDAFSDINKFTNANKLNAIRSFSTLFPTSNLPLTPAGINRYNEIVSQSLTPPNIDVSMEGIGPLPINNIQSSNLPVSNALVPGTLEYIQEQSKKNVQAFPSLTFDEFGQSVKNRGM